MADVVGAPYDDVKVEFDKVIAKYNELMADGTFSFTDAWSLSVAGLGAAITVLKPYSDLPYHMRREWAKQLAQEFFDKVVAPIDLPYIPNFFENMLDNQISNLIPFMVDSLYDALYNIIHIEDTVIKPIK